MYHILDFGNALSTLLMACIVVNREILVPVLGQIPCNEDFSPCQCIISFGDFTVNCTGVNMTEVQKVFIRTTTLRIDVLYLTAFDDQIIPPNLLPRKEVRIVSIQSHDMYDHLIVDQDAFDSSRAITERLTIEFCDLAYFDFSFLTSFSRLKSLKIVGSLNIVSKVILTLPILTSISTISLTFCSGFHDWQTFPALASGVLEILELQSNQDIDDKIMGVILGGILPSSAYSLKSLLLSENKLTKIPEELHFFSRIEKIDVHGNSIPAITNISFQSSFEFPILDLDISSSGVAEIQPDAFSGFYGQTMLDLSRNSLRFLDESTFKTLLEQMFETTSGSIDVDQNPFDCENQPCKWVWLLYDHPYLLNSLLNAKCFNDTILTDLNAEVVWSDCLMWTEPRTVTGEETSISFGISTETWSVSSTSMTPSTLTITNSTVSAAITSAAAPSIAVTNQTGVTTSVENAFPTYMPSTSTATNNILLILEPNSFCTKIIVLLSVLFIYRKFFIILTL